MPETEDVKRQRDPEKYQREQSEKNYEKASTWTGRNWAGKGWTGEKYAGREREREA